MTTTVLHKYQTEGYEGARDFLDVVKSATKEELDDLLSGGKDLIYLLSMATGTGKTIIAKHILEYMMTEYEGHCKILVLSEKIATVNQFKAKLFDEEKGFGQEIKERSEQKIYHSGLDSISAERMEALNTRIRVSLQDALKPHQFVFSTLDSLEKVDEDFDVVIVDEAHNVHKATKSYEKLEKYKYTPKIFLTATPHEDHVEEETFVYDSYTYGLYEWINSIHSPSVEYEFVTEGNEELEEEIDSLMKEIKSKEDGVEKKRLVKKLRLKAEKYYANNNGDQDGDDVGEEIDQEFDPEILKDVIDRTKDKQTIIFAKDTTEANKIENALQDMGKRAKSYHYKTSEEGFEEYKEKKIQYIVAVNKLNEAIDIPDTDAVVLMRKTDSKTIFFQQIGRILRGAGLTKYIYDYTGNFTNMIKVKELSKRIEEEGSEYDEDERKSKEMKSEPGFMMKVGKVYKEYHAISMDMLTMLELHNALYTRQSAEEAIEELRGLLESKGLGLKEWHEKEGKEGEKRKVTAKMRRNNRIDSGYVRSIMENKSLKALNRAGGYGDNGNWTDRSVGAMMEAVYGSDAVTRKGERYVKQEKSDVVNLEKKEAIEELRGLLESKGLGLEAWHEKEGKEGEKRKVTAHMRINNGIDRGYVRSILEKTTLKGLNRAGGYGDKASNWTDRSVGAMMEAVYGEDAVTRKGERYVKQEKSDVSKLEKKEAIEELRGLLEEKGLGLEAWHEKEGKEGEKRKVTANMRRNNGIDSGYVRSIMENKSLSELNRAGGYGDKRRDWTDRSVGAVMEAVYGSDAVTRKGERYEQNDVSKLEKEKAIEKLRGILEENGLGLEAWNEKECEKGKEGKKGEKRKVTAHMRRNNGIDSGYVKSIMKTMLTELNRDGGYDSTGKWTDRSVGAMMEAVYGSDVVTRKGKRKGEDSEDEDSEDEDSEE